MPFVRGAHAAGTISVGFWDHWVPGANDTLTKLCNEWAEKSKVEVKLDSITSQGSKNLLTAAAEMQARSGHDILAHPTWQPQDKAMALAPVATIIAALAKPHDAAKYTVKSLNRKHGHTSALTATTNRHN